MPINNNNNNNRNNNTTDNPVSISSNPHKLITMTCSSLLSSATKLRIPCGNISRTSSSPSHHRRLSRRQLNILYTVLIFFNHFAYV